MCTSIAAHGVGATRASSPCRSALHETSRAAPPAAGRRSPPSAAHFFPARGHHHVPLCTDAQRADLATPGTCSVLVVPAEPHLERVAFVPSLRRAVGDPVVAHQELDSASPGRICRAPPRVAPNCDVSTPSCDAIAVGSSGSPATATAATSSSGPLRRPEAAGGRSPRAQDSDAVGRRRVERGGLRVVA
jgi:hypothetical protein